VGATATTADTSGCAAGSIDAGYSWRIPTGTARRTTVCSALPAGSAGAATAAAENKHCIAAGPSGARRTISSSRAPPQHSGRTSAAVRVRRPDKAQGRRHHRSIDNQQADQCTAREQRRARP
jgi:hypothetical protein